MHIVNCNNNGQVYERFLNSGTCPWNLAPDAPGRASSREWGSETAAISYTVCTLSNSLETQVY